MAKEWSVKELQIAKQNVTNPETVKEIDRLMAIAKANTPPSQTESFGRGLAQGVTFDFADEMAGGIDAMGSIFNDDEDFGDAYTRGRDESRANYKAAREANPKTYMAGELGSALIPGFGVLKGAQAVTKGSKILHETGKAALGGAVAGGVAATGASENEDMAGMLRDTAIGAGTGFVAGPILSSGASAVGNTLGTLGGGLRRMLGEDPKTLTDRLTRENLISDGLDTAEDVWSEVQKKGGRLASVGPTTRGAAVAASKKPGPGRKIAQDAVSEDQAGQTARLTTSIQDTMNPKWKNFNQMKDDIKTKRESESAEAYEAAYSTDFQPTEKLLALQNVPSINKALRKAQTTLQDKLPSGEVATGGGGNRLELFDQAKREMDQMISVFRRGGFNDKARRLTDLKREWVSELDIVVPDYARARNIFAGSKELDDAADLGKTVLSDNKMFADDLNRITQDFSDGENEALRSGLVQGMIDLMKNSGENANSAGRLFRTERHKEVIDSIYPDSKSMGMLIETVEDENVRSRLRNSVMGGSETAERLSAQKNIEETREMSLQSGAWELARRLWNRSANPTKMKENDWEELSRKLFEKTSLEDIKRIMGSRGMASLSEITPTGNISGTIGQAGSTYAAEASAGLDIF